MNVTLILGNGFDLNMGMPTSYSDFYQYYLKLDSSVKGVDFIKEKIKDEPKTWADLEKALGDITAEYSDKVSEFDAVFSNVRDALAKYLKAVDDYNFPRLNANAFRFLQNVLDIDKFLDNKPKREYLEFIKELDNNIVLNVINFNYTSVVEKLKDYVASAQVPNKKITLNDIVHVHQTLDAGIIMGVNDDSQIANKDFRESFDIQSAMIKPFINEEFAAGNDEKCVTLISNSDVIVLFGTSLGQTDRLWWDILANDVYARRQRIIYCPYESQSMQPSHETNVIRKIRYFKASLAKSLAGDNVGMQKELMAKIYPIRNNHMFNFGFTQKDRDVVRREVIRNLLPPAPFVLG